MRSTVRELRYVHPRLTYQVVVTCQGELHQFIIIHYFSISAAKGEERVRRVRSPLKKQWKVLPKDF